MYHDYMHLFSVTFLGTGTSTGVPMIGCPCAVCQSDDTRDTRLRPSILIRTPQGNLLVDTTPDLRYQLLRERIADIQAVLYTHTHADHLLGLDDIRAINFLHDRDMPLYGSPFTLAQIERVFDYCFKETQKGGGKPRLTLHPLESSQPLMLCDLEILPLWHLHGRMPVHSFVFGGTFAYVTDVSAIPWRTWKALQGIDTLVLGTVRHQPHPTHLSLGQAITVARELGARQTYLTHLSHYLGHAEASPPRRDAGPRWPDAYFLRILLVFSASIEARTPSNISRPWPRDMRLSFSCSSGFRLNQLGPRCLIMAAVSLRASSGLVIPISCRMAALAEASSDGAAVAAA
jgi:phosphoribosyl 1,2-cyclic phosphate phosphodiesterase